ncbi:MAG: 1-acyl-sn-glycerol-3-phosphate acyltransferase [Betaproteobacteria bacterium HGW-Betaproteobacteria-3]|jgi:1-acyl-sn-glycerol-3-phosphate acyltransferase|nr:MAG: 1-acyl-sn-glycerol-3-phosphate acyltransferase [Betaproteobacteria bacterium HGW-Betaproteobacteria-3]
MTERTLQVSALWRAYEYAVMFFGLTLLALICLIWFPVAMLLYPVLPRRAGATLGRRAITVGFRAYLRIVSGLCSFRFDLSELDQLRDQGPLIIAANHPSLLDAVMITSRLPNVVCVTKSSLMDSLLFGAAARLARYLRSDSAFHVIQLSREALAEGAQLLVFPEGTRTRQFPIDTLNPMIGLIARRTGASVQTVLLELSTPYLGKDWPLFRRPTLPLHCKARLGRRFQPPTDQVALTAELDAYFRQELAQPKRDHDDE